VRAKEDCPSFPHASVSAGIIRMEGTSDGFDELYKAYKPKVARYLSRLVGPGEAEDLAQEVFLRVHRSLGTFKGESALATWIYRRTSPWTGCARPSVPGSTRLLLAMTSMRGKDALAPPLLRPEAFWPSTRNSIGRKGTSATVGSSRDYPRAIGASSS
jgi:hypothetical protein